MAKKEGEPPVPPEKEGRKAVRFSARPPPRFVKGSDFNLWVQRLELYFKEADVPAEKRGEELVSLLEDDAFRIVSQLGFIGSDGVEYDAVKTCLKEQPQQPLLVQGAQSTVEELALQAQQLSQQLSKLQAGREVGENKSSPRRAIDCWNCKKTGHVRRNCPQRQERSRDGRKDRSVKYTSAVACTLTLQGMVERRPTRMLVDTGSSVTLLHERVWNHIAGGKKLNASQCPVMAVNGESLSLCGQTKVDLMVGRHIRSHTVLVVQGMTQECLLGTDFLEQYQCVIDVRGRTMTIEGETIPLDRMSGRCMATCHVFVQETTVIPPYHEVRVQVQLEDENTNGDYVGLFQSETEMSTHHGLLFACSVSPVHNGKAVVQLVNPSSVPATLHSQEKVGQMSSLMEELDGVNMVEPALCKINGLSDAVFYKAYFLVLEFH